MNRLGASAVFAPPTVAPPLLVVGGSLSLSSQAEAPAAMVLSVGGSLAIASQSEAPASMSVTAGGSLTLSSQSEAPAALIAVNGGSLALASQAEAPGELAATGTVLATTQAVEITLSAVADNNDAQASSAVFLASTWATVTEDDTTDPWDGWESVAGTAVNMWMGGSGASSATGPQQNQAGTSGVGGYMMCETSSPNYSTKAESLQTVIAYAVDPGTAEITFYRHAYGATIGTITLDYAVSPYTTWTTLWTETGQQNTNYASADPYDLITVNADATTGKTVKLRFHYTSGAGWTGDWAVDEFSFNGTNAAGADTTAPSAVTGLAAVNADGTSVGLSWVDPVDADLDGVMVRYQTGSAPATAKDGLLGADVAAGVLAATVTGLTDGITYYFSAFAYDTSDNYSAAASVNILTDDAVPPDITDLAATAGDAENVLTWTNPGVSDFQEVDVRFAGGATPPATSGDGTSIYTGPLETYTHTGLTNGTEYSYSIWAYDDANQESAGKDTDSATPAVPAFASPNFNGSVLCFASDGAGGFFVGGAFTTVTDTVGTSTRNRVCHLDASGEVTAWNPNADNAVRSIAVDGTNVYVGGNFTSIGGQSRNQIARIDSTTGAADSWDPSPNNAVYIIAVDGTDVYAGGIFATIGGQSRNRIARIDSTTGSADSWDPNAGSHVYTIAVDGTDVCAGGLFATIGGQSRSRIARIDSTTGSADSWDPNAGHTVYTIVVDGTDVYVGGSFTTIGGQSRNRIARIDSTTGAADSWDPNAGHTVYSIAVDGTDVYVGGNFTTIGGQSRSRIARIDSTAGSADSWNPDADNSVRVIAADGADVHIGGYFTTVTTKESGGAYMATVAK
ncbi:MAG: hypothetical protein ACI9MR_000003 [Myxococcota bacterium]|jgi:hypothetical protein